MQPRGFLTVLRGEWADLPSRASCCRDPAGGIGSATPLLGWLAELGWTDLVQPRQGAVPEPRRLDRPCVELSSSRLTIRREIDAAHARLDAAVRRRRAHVWHECGGIEVGRAWRNEWKRLRRRLAIGEVRGAVEGCRLVNTRRRSRSSSRSSTSQFSSAGSTRPSVAVVDSQRFGTIMREAGAGERARRSSANTPRSSGLRTFEDGHVAARADGPRGDVRGRRRRDRVRAVWSPRIGAQWPAASIPLTPAGPPDDRPSARCRDSSRRRRAVDFPIVRGHGHEHVRAPGRAGHRGRLGTRTGRSSTSPDEIPSIEEGVAHEPTELPFTQEDFELQLEARAGAHSGNPRRTSRSGSSTRSTASCRWNGPTGCPLLGEDRAGGARAPGPRQRCGSRKGPGVGPARVAEWMTRGESEIDLQSSDIARFYPEQRTPEHVNGRASEGFKQRRTGIVHPRRAVGIEPGGVRMSPFYEQEAGARCRVSTRRPRGSAAALVRVERGARGRVRRAATRATSGTAALVVADHQCPRHLAMRDPGRRCSTSPRSRIFETSSVPMRWSRFQKVAGPADERPGRPGVIYTPVADPERRLQVRYLTIMKMDDDRFRVVTGGAHGDGGTRSVFADNLAGGRVDRGTSPSTWCTVGLWGPRRPATIPRVRSRRTMSRTRASRSAHGRNVSVDRASTCSPSRISYVGDLGWELYVPMGRRLRASGMRCGRPASPHGIVPAGHRRLRDDRPGSRRRTARFGFGARRGLHRRRRADMAWVEGEGRGTSSARRRTSPHLRGGGRSRSSARSRSTTM